jgi:hypothetical protein
LTTQSPSRILSFTPAGKLLARNNAPEFWAVAKLKPVTYCERHPSFTVAYQIEIIVFKSSNY